MSGEQERYVLATRTANEHWNPASAATLIRSLRDIPILVHEIDRLAAERDALQATIEAAGVIPVAAIAEQRAKGWADFHPEKYCHRCGKPNPVWYADSADFNKAIEVYTEIVCPQCFIQGYEKNTGDTPLWRVAPAESSDQISALTISEAQMRHERDALQAKVTPKPEALM